VTSLLCGSSLRRCRLWPCLSLGLCLLIGLVAVGQELRCSLARLVD
jgi:hypothetical protein